MNPAAWVFLATSLILAALLLITLLGGAAQRGDLIAQRATVEKDYTQLAAMFLRSEQTVADQREENDLLRGHLIRALGGRPVQPVTDAAARIASGITAAQEAASIDDEWADLNGKGDAS